ncbi:MAG: hypothetical protein ACYCO9_10180 [Streptosporangiaceae bacterium]
MTDLDDVTPPDGLTAALLQLAAHTRQLARLEERQEAGSTGLSGRVAALAADVGRVQAAVTSHGQVLAALDGIDRQVTDLAARLDAIAPADDEPDPGRNGYRPSASPRFWKPDDPALGEAAGKLRAWVEQVYRPGYGHLAAGLGECWDRHPLCLYVLDWLSELWSVLYLAPRRTQAILAGQAEWHARLLPAAADLLARETRSCPRHSGRGRSPWTGARP